MIQKVIITDYPDGSRVMSNIRNKKGVPVFKENDTYSATRVTTWYDGTPMDDSKADGKVYLKHTSSGDYYRVNLPNDGELFLEKDTVAQLRSMSAVEILLLKMGYYKGVTLNGYYKANDTPAPIQYYLSDTTEEDDGGSVFEVGGIKLEHDFGSYETSVKYFGVSNDTEALFNTQQINACLAKCNNVLIDEDLDINIEQFKDYTVLSDFASDAHGNVINIVNSNTTLTIEGTLRFNNPESIFYRLVDVSDATGVTVKGNNKGRIFGNYLLLPTVEWPGTDTYSPEHGHGVSMRNSSNTTVTGLTIQHCVGDGVYNTADRPDLSEKRSKNITITNNRLNGNGRQGISIITVDGLLIQNNIITNTGVLNGTVLGCGIDLEPEWRRFIKNVNIDNNYFEGNFNNDINILILREDTSILVENATFSNNTINATYRNRGAISVRKTALSPATIRNVNILKNKIETLQSGILFSNPIDGVDVSGNYIQRDLSIEPQTNSRGISLIGVSTGIVANNTVIGRYEHSIYQESSQTNFVNIKGNLISNGVMPMFLTNPRNITIENNIIENSERGISLAGGVGVSIINNQLKEIDGNALHIRGFCNFTTIHGNSFINATKITSQDTELSDTVRSVVSIQATNASASNYDTFVQLNSFFNDDEFPIFRHINSQNSNSVRTIISGNSSRGALITINAGDEAVTDQVYRKFGTLDTIPDSLPSSYRGLYIVSTSNTLRLWDGTSWVDFPPNASTSVKGIVNQAATSNDTATAPSETYTQAEVQAILTELRDLKTKLRTAGILET